MNNQVVLGSLVKIIKKDPIITLQENENGNLEFFHMSGKKTSIVKEDIDFSDIHSSIDSVSESLSDDIKALQTSLTEQIKSIPVYEERPDSFYKALTEEVLKGYDYDGLIDKTVQEASESLTQMFGELLVPLHDKIDGLQADTPEQEIPIDEITSLIKDEVKRLKKTLTSKKEIDVLRDEIETLKKTPDVVYPDLEIVDDHLFMIMPDGEKKHIGRVAQKTKIAGGVSGDKGDAGASFIISDGV